MTENSNYNPYYCYECSGMEMITTWTKTKMENWFACVQNVRLANFGRMNK